MKCEIAQESVMLAVYGELPDEMSISLERHLEECEGCRQELNALRALDDDLAHYPVAEPTPNLLAQSRVRLDEALDQIPPHGILTQLRCNLFNCLGHMQGAPALMTLLIGVGFLGGNFTNRYQAAREAGKNAGTIIEHQAQGTVANVTGIVQTPNSELVQVNYNRMVPETLQGSLDSPEVRRLLMVGMTESGSPEVREHSVNLLSNECKVGHQCTAEKDGKGIRSALMVSLRYDKNAGVRMKALEGLQPYVEQDQRVRDAVLEALAHDNSAGVRKAAVDVLVPVESDSSVRQVLRTVSSQDDNPYIRTASYRALQSSANIQ